MTAAKRPQPENKPSSLLSLEENDQLFKLIGQRCKVSHPNSLPKQSYFKLFSFRVWPQLWYRFVLLILLTDLSGTKDIVVFSALSRIMEKGLIS